MRQFRVLALLLLVAACAKKMPPPNPDRFPPSLQDLVTVNRNRIDLVFDEPMKSDTLALTDYSIVNLTGDTLVLQGIAISGNNTTVSLYTRKQEHGIYELTGAARDQAGNPTHFMRRFRGSERPDTIFPVITLALPRLYDTKLRTSVTVRFSFSKAVDTLSFPGVFILPESLRGRFGHDWNPSFTEVKFGLKDSLPARLVLTFILPPTFRDFSGNHPARGGVTAFTSDSLFPAKVVRGRIEAGGRPPPNGYIVLVRERPVLATLTREDGSFSLRADSESYAVVAAADTNYDGRIELMGTRELAPLPDSFVVQLKPDTKHLRLDSLFSH